MGQMKIMFHGLAGEMCEWVGRQGLTLTSLYLYKTRLSRNRRGGNPMAWLTTGEIH